MVNRNQLQDVSILKDATVEMVKNKLIPNRATKKLYEILSDETINGENYIKELKKIVHSSEKLDWDRLFSKFQSQIGKIPAIPFFGVLLIFFFAFLFRKTNFVRKLNTKLLPFTKDVVKRLIAVFAYSVPFSALIANYYNNTGRGALPKAFKMADVMIPRFLEKSAHFYEKSPNFLSILYLLLVLRCVIKHFPKPRILRFHLLQGFLFYAFQNYPKQLIHVVVGPAEKNFSEELVTSINLLVFLLNLYWLLPGLFQAVTLSYPKSRFLREAVEINLGRDQEGPDGAPFKWWNR